MREMSICHHCNLEYVREEGYGELHLPNGRVEYDVCPDCAEKFKEGRESEIFYIEEIEYDEN